MLPLGHVGLFVWLGESGALYVYCVIFHAMIVIVKEETMSVSVWATGTSVASSLLVELKCPLNICPLVRHLLRCCK